MLKKLLFAVLLLFTCAAQAAVYSLPWGPKPQFVDANGAPMSSGTVTFFAAGSTTPQNTYTSSTGGVANANPITLNTRGESPNEVWLTGGQTYKAVLKDSSGATVWTVDNISGINDITISNAPSEWIAGPTPTYVSATQFTLAGDQTLTFTSGRRVRTTNSGGTVYSTIASSVFGALTTITLTNDSSSLDAGLSAVSYGMLNKTNDSMPRGIFPTMGNVTKYIYGLTYANASGDVTNDIDIAAGGAVDATGAYFMTLSAITKQSDATWAVGTNAGGLDTGVVGNNKYYIWVIARPDTNIVDALFSLSATAPTMPANYTYKRLVGWFVRSGGAIGGFKTYELLGGGLQYSATSPSIDVDSAALTTARLLSTINVPLDFTVIADVRYLLFNAGSLNVILQCPDESDQAPSAGAGAGLDVVIAAGASSVGRIKIRTSATGQIAARASGAVSNYRIWTVGWEWSRR